MCTIFAFANNSGKVIVGRNFDFFQKGGTIHFLPSYRSYGIQTIGCALVEQMGVDRPYEGFNVNGLFVGMAAVSDVIQPSTNCSNVMNDLGVMRFILERASTTAEAVDILMKFRLDYMQEYGYPKVHYLVVDIEGNAAVYNEGSVPEIQRLVANKWLAITNTPVREAMSCSRYQILNRELSERDVLSEEDAVKILAMVKLEEMTGMTVWSSVYNLTERKFQIFIEQMYGWKFEFDLLAELGKGQTSIDFGYLKLRGGILQQKQAG